MRVAADNATRAAYQRWAPSYPPVAHNPLMRAEQRAMLALWPEVAERRVLDLASGSGRYSRLLRERGAAEVVAVDFCEPMVRGVDAWRICADMMHLPLGNQLFDVVVSGLAIGHAPCIDGWMREMARVLKPGGVLLYSDFHADATLAGLTRSFKDLENRTVTVPHAAYDVGRQRRSIHDSGLELEVAHEVRVGVELTETFAHSADFYSQWQGLPIVLVIRARKCR